MYCGHGCIFVEEFTTASIVAQSILIKDQNYLFTKVYLSTGCLIQCLNTNCVLSPPNRQEALLAAISEKDANIALLELSSSKKKKTQDEVALLKREKDRLVHQLKQQVRTTNRLDVYTPDHGTRQNHRLK